MIVIKNCKNLVDYDSIH